MRGDITSARTATHVSVRLIDFVVHLVVGEVKVIAIVFDAGRGEVLLQSFELRNIAEAERTPPSSIHRRIDSDLETVALRALAKDRAQEARGPPPIWSATRSRKGIASSSRRAYPSAHP